ncbi:AAA+ ATPase superfamily predicted ATPase [Halorubrum trapanicum]|uniref:AAA+ ATPase superfamily predicted ATPase n=1 Tax=Halorubrum trapanicum TaxID=29284 RepID=A0A8J7R5G9_9EURY|nr:ATP-binding protein [Halorubrum trapanicum]MBP1900479.1 AAA+ ATPase superfamily predicted ATPase [Halorubrum trapanicum]
MDHFVDREDELSRLRGCYESDDAEMVVIFGRRRLGKTQLVQHSLSDRDNAVVYQATETTSQIQLDEFVDVASESFPGITQIKQNWEALLGYLGDQDAIVVLDEFPYLIDADESLPSVIQRLWDQRLQNTSGTLVLVGSSISMMEEATLLGNSPLYGRFTERLDLRPLDFAAAQEFVPDECSPEERIFTWGIFGGVPYYLDDVGRGQSLGTVLTEELLSQKGYLHNEPEYVLRTELTDPNRYFAILTAIAAGKTTSNEIAQAIGIDGKQISTYTQKLERLRLIEREVPITEEKAKSRRGRYRILDPLFRFWFRFVYGKEDRYERLGENAYDAVIEPELPDFVSREFERLCQDALPGLYPDETFLDLGRWWYKEHEVDVVGFTTDGTMVVGECKFTNAPLDYGALASLEDHAAEIRWTPDGDERTTKYALFTRKGSTQSVQEAVSERDDVRLFDLADITRHA